MSNTSSLNHGNKAAIQTVHDPRSLMKVRSIKFGVVLAIRSSKPYMRKVPEARAFENFNFEILFWGWFPIYSKICTNENFPLYGTCSPYITWERFCPEMHKIVSMYIRGFLHIHRRIFAYPYIKTHLHVSTFIIWERFCLGVHKTFYDENKTVFA